MKYVNDAMRAQIGVETEKRTAAEPIGSDALRRFVHATMEENPVHFDPAEAGKSRFGGVVAPPLYPVHAFRRPAASPDPLDRASDDRDWDGSGSNRSQLPPLDLPFVRHLNGGSEVEFFQCAKVGDVISEVSSYSAIEEKDAESGPMVLVTIETTYSNQDGEILLKVRKTGIHR